MVMDRRPPERAQHAGVLHRLVAALGLHLIMGQRSGGGHMEPRQLSLDSQPGLIDIPHLTVASQRFHRRC